MADNAKPFDAAVVRYRHDPATGEFVNIGVVLAARDGSFKRAVLLEDWGRVFSAFPGANSATLEAISRTLQHALPLALRDNEELVDALRAIFPPDDSGVEIAAPVSGATPDFDRTLNHLFARQVARHLPATVEWVLHDAPAFAAEVRATPVGLPQPAAKHVAQPAHEWLEPARIGVR